MAEEDLAVDLELDLRGLLCPLPMVRVSQNIRKIAVGGVIRATTTDPESLTDIPLWARTTGNDLMRTDRNGGEFTFYLRRVK